MLPRSPGPKPALGPAVTAARRAAAPPSRTKAERTRAGLVAATRAELAATSGFTAERVAARAGTSAATFYAYFPTKDEALAAAFGLVLDDLVARTNAALSIERLLDEGLEATCAALVDELVAVFRADALVFRAALARMVDHRAIRELYRRSETASLAHLERFIERGQAAGLIAGGPALERAELLLVLSQGVNNPRLLRARAHSLTAGWTAALVDALRPR